MRIIRQTVRRITDEILGVKGLNNEVQSAKLVIIMSYSASLSGTIILIFQGVAPHNSPSFNNRGLKINQLSLEFWLSFKQTIRLGH